MARNLFVFKIIYNNLLECGILIVLFMSYLILFMAKIRYFETSYKVANLQNTWPNLWSLDA